MKALVFNGPWDMTIDERPDPRPSKGEVLLDVLATGICGSDLHGYTGENGRRHPGQVMGHETVARVREDTTGTYRPGLVVTVNPVIGCGQCAACTAGQNQRCADRRVIGVAADISSAFAEQMLAPARNIVPLPAGTAAEVGSLVEPLAVGYHAARRVVVGSDDTVLVVGGGPIGQAAALAARRVGSASVVVSEPDTARRALVERLGFATVDPTTDSPEMIMESLGGPASVALDAVGTSQTIQAAFDTTGLGARIVLVGMNVPRIELSAYAISTEERTLVGSFCYSAPDFADTAAWATQRVDELLPLIDGRVCLTDAPATFEALSKGDLTASKVLVYVGDQPPVG